MGRNLSAEHFLLTDADAQAKARLRGGEVKIEPETASQDIDVPGGTIQDWRGKMFIPRATLAQVKAVLQDYESYKHFYKPEVIESKELGHHDDEYDIFLRLYKKQFLSVVLNTTYRVQYRALDPRRLAVTSRSTRIAEVADLEKSQELPPGDDTGFLWRLNSYWRFEESDGGVYAECEAISLSRDVPLGLGWMVKGFISKFPKDSMQNTLRGTRKAVEARQRLETRN